MPQPATGRRVRFMKEDGRAAFRPAGGARVFVGPLHLGRLHLAADLLARALRDVLPLVGVVVGLRAEPRAGVLARAAVVLAGLGDAVALLAVLGLGGGLGGGRR